MRFTICKLLSIPVDTSFAFETFKCSTYENTALTHFLLNIYVQTYIFFIQFGRLGVGAFQFGFSVPTAVCGYLLADCIPPLCLSGPSRSFGRLVTDDSLALRKIRYSVKYTFNYILICFRILKKKRFGKLV